MTISVEVVAVLDFLAQCPPFNQLPESQLIRAASQVEIAYYRAGSATDIPDYSCPQRLN